MVGVCENIFILLVVVRCGGFDTDGRTGRHRIAHIRHVDASHGTYKERHVGVPISKR